MAYPALKVLEPTTGAVLYDFNDETGLANPELVKTRIREEDFDLGVPDISLGTFASPYGGGLLTKRETLFAQTTARVWAEGTSIDALRRSMGYLSTLLDKPGVMSWQPDASSTISYIDYLGSTEVPSMFRDGPSVLHLMQGNRHAPGFVVSVLRQPHLREDTLLASVNKLSNSWPLREGATAGRPLNWTWSNTTALTAESINNEGYHFTRATSTAAQLEQTTGAASAAPGDIWTMSGDVTALGSIAKVFARIEYLNSSSTVISTFSATPTLVNGTERFTVTTTAAPALTDRIRASLVFDHDVATAVDITVNKLQLEEASTASDYRTGAETLSNDPAGYCALPVWNGGDSDARAEIVLGNHSIDWEQLLVAQFRDHGTQGTAGVGLGVIDRLQSFIQGGYLIPSSDASAGLEAVDADTSHTTGLGTTYSAGDALVTTFADPSSKIRATYNGSSASQHSLADHTVAVFGRFSTSNATGVFNLQLDAHHGLGSVSHLLDAVPVQFQAADTLYDLFLGTATLRAASTWDFHAARTAGTGSLRTDLLYMVPLDAMMVVDSTNNRAVKINAHAEAKVLNTILSDTTLNDGVAASYGEVPIIPPGLSALLVRMWRPPATGFFVAGEELQGKPKLNVLADSFTAWVDITPTRHQ